MLNLRQHLASVCVELGQAVPPQLGPVQERVLVDCIPPSLVLEHLDQAVQPAHRKSTPEE